MQHISLAAPTLVGELWVVRRLVGDDLVDQLVVAALADGALHLRLARLHQPAVVQAHVQQVKYTTLRRILKLLDSGDEYMRCRTWHSSAASHCTITEPAAHSPPQPEIRWPAREVKTIT